MTIRVFIASCPDGVDAEANLACEHSIRSRASEPVEITWMMITRNSASPWYSDPQKGEGWDTSRWVTPFSGLRWAIPEVCGFEGRAIYTDNDTLWLADIAGLFHMPLAPGKACAAKSSRRFCVTMFDCAASRPHIPGLSKLQRGAGNTIKGSAQAVQDFTSEQAWNALDGDNLPVEQIKCLHFTSIDSQPNVPLAVARLTVEGRKHWFDGQVKPHWRPELTALWQAEFDAGIAAGRKVADYVPAETFGKVPKRSLQGYRGLHAR